MQFHYISLSSSSKKQTSQKSMPFCLTKHNRVSKSQAWWYTPTVPATQEAETRGSLESRISGHPGQHGKTLSQKQSKTYKKRISVVKYENIHRKIILLL
jgi:hypothetical protein